MDITQIPVNPLRRVVVEFGKLLANQNSDLNKAICKALNICRENAETMSRKIDPTKTREELKKDIIAFQEAYYDVAKKDFNESELTEEATHLKKLAIKTSKSRLIETLLNLAPLMMKNDLVAENQKLSDEGIVELKLPNFVRPHLASSILIKFHDKKGKNAEKISIYYRNS